MRPAPGVTSRRGPLRVSYRSPATTQRVLVSIPRSVGTAVVRNRTRRRLREALRELVRDGAIPVIDGEFHLRVSAPLENVPPAELRVMLTELTMGARRG